MELLNKGITNMAELKGIHIHTWEGEAAHYLYDKFCHNEITVDEIIQK